jgi:DmsE family decaheme c-type cytochrome
MLQYPVGHRIAQLCAAASQIGNSVARAGPINCRAFALALIAFGIATWSMFGLARPVAGGETQQIEDVYAALREFAEAARTNGPTGQVTVVGPSATMAPENPRIPNDIHHGVLRSSTAQPNGELAAISSPGDAADGELFSALRNYVRDHGAAAGQSPKAESVQLAQAKERQPAAAGKSKWSTTVGRPAPAHEATLVGTEVCLTCHATQAAAFSRTLMGRLKTGCETCHGPGSAHVAAGGGRGVGGIISFRADDHSRTAAENNAICLGCHDKGDRAIWQGSTHETRGLACTNCHSVMKNLTPKHQLAKANEIDVCFQCHKNKRAETWRSSHMPVREGKMTCTNCHNPHGSFSDSLLKEATVNDNCYKCHAEKRGPFLWEHAPVRENCANCHDPHGSNNDFLLKISRPRLCQQCHSALTGHPANPRNPFSTFAINRECQNCHSQHHGSNSPSGARFHR